jgi:hypothetical protein
MVTICALALLCSPDAKADVAAVFARYKALKSYSATIECQDASGLYPGHFVLALKWAAGQKFEMSVVEPTKPTPTNTGNPVPSFSCDGKTVTRKTPNGAEHSDSINTDPNRMPGYEVAGGLVMTALLDSPNAKMFLSPPPQIKIAYSYGKTAEWKGTKVKEIVMTFEMGERKDDFSVFLTEDGKWFVGMQYPINGKSGWIHYKDAKHETD